MRYKPKNIAALHVALGGLPGKMRVGYAGTAPVGCFKPNGYGLYDMIGNV